MTAGISDTRALALSLDVALRPDTDERHWAAAAGLLPRVLDLLLDAPVGTVLSLNAPDRPPGQLRELKDARLARGGAVSTQVADLGDDGLHLGEIEVADVPEEGTDTALLAAGHPTLTALRSVEEADGDLVRKWLAGGHAS